MSFCMVDRFFRANSELCGIPEIAQVLGPVTTPCSVGDLMSGRTEVDASGSCHLRK